MDTPSTAVGPGLGAFLAFFALAIVLWFLMRNMNGRMRRMAYVERERLERLEAQELAQREAASGAAGATATPAEDAAPQADPQDDAQDDAPDKAPGDPGATHDERTEHPHDGS